MYLQIQKILIHFSKRLKANFSNSNLNVGNVKSYYTYSVLFMFDWVFKIKTWTSKSAIMENQNVLYDFSEVSYCNFLFKL